MYCKFCGKEIDHDSSFCKHCGVDLSLVKPSSSIYLKGLSNLKSWFTGLSKRRQICLMIYFLWFWGVFVFCSIPDNGLFLVTFPILVIIIPAAVLMLGYAYRHKWFKWDRYKPKIKSGTSPQLPPNRNLSSMQDRNNRIIESQLSDGVEVHTEPEIIIIKTYPLTEFAAEHGKMQLQKDYDKRICSYIVSYVFTNKNGKRTKVLPAEGISSLTAEEISNQKYILCVNEYSDGTFRLNHRVFEQNPEVDYMTHPDE